MQISVFKVQFSSVQNRPIEIRISKCGTKLIVQFSIKSWWMRKRRQYDFGGNEIFNPTFSTTSTIILHLSDDYGSNLIQSTAGFQRSGVPDDSRRVNSCHLEMQKVYVKHIHPPLHQPTHPLCVDRAIRGTQIIPDWWIFSLIHRNLLTMFPEEKDHQNYNM